MPDGALRARATDGGNSIAVPVNISDLNLASRPSAGGPGNGVDQNLLNYLLANTEPGTYLVATGGANSAAGYILATGRPVLAVGGFLNQYDEVSVDQLSSLVKSGRLRFVLSDALDRHQALAQWVKQNCAVVDASAYGGAAGTGSGNFNGPTSSTLLYQCGG